jgi:hypothetical protein
MGEWVAADQGAIEARGMDASFDGFCAFHVLKSLDFSKVSQ